MLLPQFNSSIMADVIAMLAGVIATYLQILLPDVVAIVADVIAT